MLFLHIESTDSIIAVHGLSSSESVINYIYYIKYYRSSINSHTCGRLRIEHNQCKRSEKHEENGIDQQVAQISPQTKLKPLAVQ